MQSISNISIPLSWKAIVKQVFGLDAEIQAVYFYESKKNQVSRLKLIVNGEPTDVVAKKYVWGDMDSEIAVLRKAGSLGLAVPQFIARFSDIAFFTPVPGVAMHNPLTEEQARLIGKWMKSFHEKMTPQRARGTFLRGDCTLKNFIYDEEGGKVYSLDFEQAYFGPAEDDLAELIATLLVGTKAESVWDSPHILAVKTMLRAYKRKFNALFLYEGIIQGLINRMEFRQEYASEIQMLIDEFRERKELLVELLESR